MKANRYLVFMGLGFELVGLIIGGIYLGQLLDAHFGTRGIMVLVILASCLVSWFIHLVFLLKRVEKMGAGDDD